MGIDAMIFVQYTGEDIHEEGLNLPDDWLIFPVDGGDHPKGATHEVSGASRLYTETYKRGCWPTICGALMSLHACHHIRMVWYDGDCNDPCTHNRCSPTRVLALCEHYMRAGQ